jgi:metacaspase-1
MPKGLSLHIGVNHYDNASYRQRHTAIERPIPSLPNCDRDAMAKKAIADRFAFTSALLINKEATATEVIRGIAAAGHYLDDGDLFFLSFSGHGSRISDRNGDEDDGYDETWCLYDQMLPDDELFALLQRFRPGVRVLVIADSCHSGTSTKDIVGDLDRPGGAFPVQKTDEVLASCLLMAACQDAEKAMAPGNMGYSLYTHWMLKILECYAFCDSYRELHHRICRQMPRHSTPNLFPFGPGAQQFMQSRPFHI